MTIDRPVTKVPIANIERTYRATAFLRQLCVPNEPTVSPGRWNHYAFTDPRLAWQVAGAAFKYHPNDTQNKNFAVVTGALEAGVKPVQVDPIQVDLFHVRRSRGSRFSAASTGHLTRLLLPDMIASEAPGPFEAIYAASKAFDLSFAQAIRMETGGHRN